VIIGIGTKTWEVKYHPQYVHSTKKEVSPNIEVKKKLRDKEEIVVMGSNRYNSRGHNQRKISGMQIFKVVKKSVGK
jgi:hypothetical protein